MLEPINFDKPVYNAVNIKIRKPEVNAGATNPTTINNDNGIYNAVKINIDNPKVNTQPVYEYPEADRIITYGMIDVEPYALPEGYPLADAYPAYVPEETEEKKTLDLADTVVEVPEPNYTTLEAEKGIREGLSFRGNSPVKKPEIIPSEPILPAIDINAVKKNLKSDDYDKQALQMEEIVKAGLVKDGDAKPYLVSDVFSALIAIVQKDVTKLAPPTKQQNEARIKIINAVIAAEKNPQNAKQYEQQISDKDINLANTLSPMEMAIRNKEYALATLGVLANCFINEVEKHESRIVPITDVPGVSAIVDALRKEQDPSIKLAALDALRLIARDEYKNEFSVLFNLAKNDKNPDVARTAVRALAEIS